VDLSLSRTKTRRQTRIPNFLIDKEEVMASSDGSIVPTGHNTSPTTGQGSVLGTVLINLPRAAYEAAGRDERLFQNIMQGTRHAVNGLDRRRQLIQERLGEGLLHCSPGIQTVEPTSIPKERVERSASSD